MNFLQIVGVGAAYHIASAEIRMTSANAVQIIKVVEFSTGKFAVRRYKPQIGEQRCGGVVYMGRLSDPVICCRKSENFIE